MKKQDMFNRMKPRKCKVCNKTCKNYASESVHLRQHGILTQGDKIHYNDMISMRSGHSIFTGNYAYQVPAYKPVKIKPLQRYKVRNGDSLWRIAVMRFGSDSGMRWKEIYEINKEVIKNVNAIPVGTILIMP